MSRDRVDPTSRDRRATADAWSFHAILSTNTRARRLLERASTQRRRPLCGVHLEKKMKRRILTESSPNLLIVAILMAGSGLTLTACGASDASGSDTESTATAAEEPTQQPLPLGVAPGQGRDLSGLLFGNSNSHALSWVGGGGGSQHNWTAGAHAVIYGVQGRSDAWLDAIQFLYYIPSNADNLYRTGDFYGSFGQYGGGGGYAKGTYRCPSNTGLTGISGDAGSYIDFLELDCADTWNPTLGWTHVGTDFGGYGGSLFSRDCPAGELMTGVNVRTGSYVDAIQPLCTPAN